MLVNVGGCAEMQAKIVRFCQKKKNRQFHLYGIISDGTGSFSVQYSNKQNPPKIFDVKFVQRDDETLC